ncbi:unnamed protein product [Calypogeia fissa]
MEAAAPLLPTPDQDGKKLRRELTLLDSLSIVVGIIVGSGIFTTPGVVLAQAGSVGEGLIMWLVAGGLTLCSALIYAELGTSIPVSSGDVEFLRTAFGPSWAFSFIWTSFLVLFPGSINIFAIALGQYFLAAITSADFSTQDVQDDPRVIYIAITSVVGLTVYNFAGVRFRSFLQNAFGLCKILLVFIILLVAAVFLTSDTSILQANFSKPFVGSSFLGIGPSMVATLWAYDGLPNIVFLTEEMKNPSRDIPRVSYAGCFLVTSIYLAVNLAYLSVLPSSDVKNSFIVAMDSTGAVFGHQAGRFTAILVFLSLLGSLNAIILCGGRYLFSAARDGHFLYGEWFGTVNQRTGAPVVALLAQGVWSVFILLLSDDVVKLLNYFSISAFFFTGLIALAHWKLRYQYPELPRPFRVPLHPSLNVIVISTSLYMIVSSIATDPVAPIGSLLFCFSSFPVYQIFFKKTDSKTRPGHENVALLS